MCFGYRILEHSFESLTDLSAAVNELCGTAELSCPRLSPPSSPDNVLTQPSLEPNVDFIMGDYVDSDEDLETVLARIHQQESRRAEPMAPSVRRSYAPFPLTNRQNFRHLPLVVGQPSELGKCLQAPTRNLYQPWFISDYYVTYLNVTGRGSLNFISSSRREKSEENLKGNSELCNKLIKPVLTLNFVHRTHW